MAGALSFDDLVPQAVPTAPAATPPAAPPSSGAALSFDDLVPKTPVAPPTPAEPAPGPLRGADDIVRLLANGVTLGYADKLASMVNGTPIETERQHSADSAARTGGVGKVASLVGTMAPTMAAGEVVAPVAAAARAVPLIGRLIGGPIAEGAATGAITGAGDAAGHDQPIGQGAGLGALYGAGAGGAAAAGGATLRGVGSLFADRPTVPTSDELRNAAQGAYAAADNAGVVYAPQAVDRLNGTIQQTMADFGYHPSLQPGGDAVVNALEDNAGQNVTLRGVDALRKMAGNMTSPAYPSAGTLGRQIQGNIDDFTSNPRPGDILMGNGADGVEALTNARRLWNMSSKDQTLSEALDRAERGAGSSGSGGNINNSTRQRVNQAYQSRSDWTPDEDAALRSVVMGTPTSNLARQLGKLSPEGNGLMLKLSTMGLSPALGGYVTAGAPGALAGAAVPATGYAAKKLGDYLTQRALTNAQNIVRGGGTAAAVAPIPNAAMRVGSVMARPAANVTLADILSNQYGP